MATITTNGAGAGNSSDGASYAGGVHPAATDKVVVDDGDILTLDEDFECGTGSYPADSSPYDNPNWSLQLKGTLKASHTVDSSLNVDGLMNYYRSSGAGHSKLDFEDVPETVQFSWNLNPQGNMTSRGYYYACSLYANNSSRAPSVRISSAHHRRRNTFIIGEVSAGANTFTVDDATGWKAGDELLIAPKFTGTNQWSTNHEYEELIIQSVSGNDITLTAGLTYDHGYADANDHPAAAVSNKTSNVKIMGYDDSHYCPSVYILRADWKMKDVVGDYLNNGYSLNADIFRIAHLGIYSGLERTWESCFFQADGTNLDYYLYGIIYTNSVYDTYGVMEVKDIALNYKPRSNRTANYGIDSYYTGRAIKITDCNIYTSQRYHGSYPFSDYQQPATYRNCKAFNSQYSFSLHDNALTTAIDCWSIGTNYGTMHYNGTAKFIDHHFRWTNYLTYPYYGWIGFAQYIRPDFDDAHITHTNQEEYLYQSSNGNPDGCNWAFNDIQNNTTKQITFKSYGLFARDTSIFATSVASVRAKPKISDKILKFETAKYMNTGQTLDVSVQMRKNSDYNGSSRPLIRLKCSQFDVTQEMTNTNDTWETVTLSGPAMTAAEAVTISLEVIGTAGYGWFDDLKIENQVYDIGNDLFSGGTETSNVIDITDTTVDVVVKTIDASTKATISGAHVAVLRNSDKSVLTTGTTDASGIYTYNMEYTTDIDIVGWGRESDISGTDYVQKEFSGTITSSGFNVLLELSPI